MWFEAPRIRAAHLFYKDLSLGLTLWGLHMRRYGSKVKRTLQRPNDVESLGDMTSEGRYGRPEGAQRETVVTKHRIPEPILRFVDKKLLRPVLPLQAYGLTPSPTGCDQHDRARKSFQHAIVPPNTSITMSMFKPQGNDHRRSRLEELAIPTANSSTIRPERKTSCDGETRWRKVANTSLYNSAAAWSPWK